MTKNKLQDMINLLDEWVDELDDANTNNNDSIEAVYQAVRNQKEELEYILENM